MKIFNHLMTAAICAALLVPMATAEQDRQHQRRYQQQRTQQDRAKMKRDLAQKKVRGEVVDYRAVKLKGMNEKHVLAKVRMDSGRTIMADLGPISNLRKQRTRLHRGQQIQGAGRTGRLNKKPIIVLDSLVGDGQFTIIAPEIRSANDQRQRRGAYHRTADRQRAGQQDRQRQMRQAHRYIVLGRITDLRRVDVRGYDRSHRVANVRTARGRNIVVDLGTGRELQDVNLTRNEWIQVIGPAGRINGKPAIFAEALADVAVIERPEKRDRREGSRVHRAQWQRN